MSDPADLLTGLVEELSWERTASNACAVGFEDTVYMADLLWAYSESYACS